MARIIPAVELAPSVPSKFTSVVKVCAAICAPDTHSQSATNITETPNFLVATDNAANSILRVAANLRAFLQIIANLQ